MRYSISGTATNAIDYRRLSGSVIMAAGQSSAPIWVIPRDDRNFEADETVVITLLESASYVIGSPNSATCTIAANDFSRPLVNVAARKPSASRSGIGDTLTFSRTGDASGTLISRYIAGGTETRGRDYGGVARIPETVATPANCSSAGATGNTIEDMIEEGDETVIAVASTSSADIPYSSSRRFPSARGERCGLQNRVLQNPGPPVSSPSPGPEIPQEPVSWYIVPAARQRKGGITGESREFREWLSSRPTPHPSPPW